MECYTSSSSSDLEAGFSTYKMNQQKNNNNWKANKVSFFCDDFNHSYDEHHYFLDSCFLCNKPLTGHRDIFMYRGDTAFCSEECREEQIDIDESKEKNSKMFRSSKEQQKQKAQRVHVRSAGHTVVAGY